MKSTLCEISFPNNPTGVFYGGQPMSGSVVLTLTKPKTVKGIYVKIIGRAYCRWRTGAGHHTKTHTGQEFYLNEKTFLVGDNCGEVLLTPKPYNYTFSCTLPAALPTSVEGSRGYIRYSVAVHMENSMWSHQQFNKHFTVIKALNLNDEAVLRYPLVKVEQTSFLTCRLLLCLKPGPLIISGGVPVRGYVPGQVIDLLLKINNLSDQSIRNFTIQIIKMIQYHTHANSSATKCDNSILKSFLCNGCPKNQLKTYRIPITVPSVPPTDESTSNIVKVRYQLLIQGLVGFFHDNPVLTFPIKIGTYPIFLASVASTQPQTLLSPEPDASISFNQDVGSTSSVGENDDGIDPPAYEEAILNCSGEFRPFYPVFKRPPSYSTIS